MGVWFYSNWCITAYCVVPYEQHSLYHTHTHTLITVYIIQVSALHWDHNDEFSQFSGTHVLLPNGYMSVLSQLTAPNLCFGKNVTRIDQCDDGHVRVCCEGGQEWLADRVSE